MKPDRPMQTTPETTPLFFNTLADRIDGDVAASLLDRVMLATDGSIFQRRPAAVVYPRSTRDVIETVDFARRQGLSIHPRGAGSGLCGAALGTGIVIDFTRYMNRLIELDVDAGRFVCEPGYRFGELACDLAGKGLFFPPDPSSGEYASFGGMVGTNASGAHSVKYGNVADYLTDAEVVLGSGRTLVLSTVRQTPIDQLPADLSALAGLYTENRVAIEAAYPPVRHNVSGYNLRGLVKAGRLHLERLFAGAEGTLGVATRLTFRLLPKPACDSLVVAFFDNIDDAARAVQLILPMQPAGIEIMDKSLLGLARENDPLLARRIPVGIDNVLLVAFDGENTDTTETLGLKAKGLIETGGLCTEAHLAVSAEEKARFWAVRKAAVPILYKLKGEKKILALIEDAVVPTDRLVDYFAGIYRILEASGVRFVVYGHIAKGLLHTRPLLDLKDPADIARLQPLADAVFTLVNGLGGAVSGEHGDGRLRSTYIRRQYPGIFRLFQQTKAILDPANLMNPEIITASTPDQMTRHLRYGTDYRQREFGPNQLVWPDGWAAEIERCHGCTKCTTVTTATRMCPIYKFTRREAAAPKAKANLLRTLISGQVDDAMLYAEAFQSVIDHCVGCGSCRRECPSEVDIPKMALEARARYVARFGPGLHSRLVTAAETLGRTGCRMPGPLNALAKRSPMRRLGQALAGISANRPLVVPQGPSLFSRVSQQRGDGKVAVLFFAGCYAGYLRPAIGVALVNVLSRLGCAVFTPPQHCCGLPLATKGMVRQARGKIQANLDRWYDLARRVDHIAVTCSSCGLALAHEWGDLVDSPKVRAVAGKLIHASRLIAERLDEATLHPWPARLAYHQPCHLKLQTDPASSVTLMGRLPGVVVDALASHCCGMAGTWGMAAKNDALSRRIGAHLMALTADAHADATVTDCPTCEMQMAQLGPLAVMHPVEVVAKTMEK